ncbi:hypothetical protein NDU88_004014 [Pleurodeles waltl]|uniref:Uncharacterized protein n=1 Tax=Pleurodeles waltl TaxID=8319 RepID=A0AAV7TSX6_PLEWA|nr:hypothetical protein NDU88_004014 [Pleurodeles waltl]
MASPRKPVTLRASAAPAPMSLPQLPSTLKKPRAPMDPASDESEGRGRLRFSPRIESRLCSRRLDLRLLE